MVEELKESYILQSFYKEWVDFESFKTKEELLERFNFHVEITNSMRFRAIFRLEEIIEGPRP